MKLSLEKIKIFMARADMNNSDLAKELGVARQRVSTLINQRSCSTKTANKLAKALGVDVTEILED